MSLLFARLAWYQEDPAYRQATGDPEQTARRADTRAGIREVMDDDLSERQRQALTAVVADEVPLDERRPGGSRPREVLDLFRGSTSRFSLQLPGGDGGVPHGP